MSDAPALSQFAPRVLSAEEVITRVEGHQRSLRDIARELEALGYVNQHGKQFSAASVQSMLGLMNNGPSYSLQRHRDR